MTYYYTPKDMIYCKHCDYKCYKLKQHFMCEFRKCKKIDYNICIFNQPYCRDCLNTIKRFEEYIDKYTELI